MSERSALALALTIMAGLLVFMYTVDFARGQDNGHTHEGASGRFYQSWMMPDAPHTSCCHDQDCGPTASRIVNNKWQAQDPEGDWIDIPENKIEQDKDSPDGRSHLCGRKFLGGFSVFCFVRGGGT